MLLSYTNSKDSTSPHGIFLYFFNIICSQILIYSSGNIKNESFLYTSCVINAKNTTKSSKSSFGSKDQR